MYGLIALNFIIPFVMVFVGYILKKHPVKDMTSGNGYNTPTSRKSQEHWDYAQSIAPNIFIGIGKTLGLVEIVLCISLSRFMWSMLPSGLRSHGNSLPPPIGTSWTPIMPLSVISRCI